MFNYTCLNPIAGVGLDLFSDDYKKVDDIKDADAALVRSAAMHDMELGDKVLAVARAGAGVNNIPLDKCAEQGIVVFNTPGANANGVKELVFAGMLYASRDIVGGIDWCLANQNDENIAKTAEKQKKNFAGTEISGKMPHGTFQEALSISVMLRTSTRTVISSQSMYLFLIQQRRW